MVKRIIEEDKELCQCEECGMQYDIRELAEKCQAWCKEHQSCNIEITRHAIKDGEESGTYEKR